jgi:hypothetical protein
MLAAVAKVVAVHDAAHDHVKSAVHKIVDAKVDFVGDVHEHIADHLHKSDDDECECDKECDDCECDCGDSLDEKAVKVEVVKEKEDDCEKDCEHEKEYKHGFEFKHGFKHHGHK